MSEVMRWITFASIAAIVLIWMFMTWRNRQRSKQPNSANNSTDVDSFWGRNPILFGLIALGLAGLAQYALRINQTELAALGYGLATILFISAMNRYVPIKLIDDPNIPVTKPISVSESTPIVSNFGTGATTESPTFTAASAPTVNPVNLGTPLIEVVKTNPSTDNQSSTPMPALVRVWSGFNQPDSIVITPQGQILVLDIAQKIIHRLNPNGQSVQQWSVPPLPEFNGRNLAVSADGHQLYITDATKGLIYVITLED